MRRSDVGLRVEVRDGGRPFPPGAPEEWDLDAEGGRGLPLVHALADSWGSISHPDRRNGKTLWFQILENAPVSAS